jgi:hypothetical protein
MVRLVAGFADPVLSPMPKVSMMLSLYSVASERISAARRRLTVHG